MTMRYIHPTPQHKREALKKLENFAQGTPKITPKTKNGEKLESCKLLSLKRGGVAEWFKAAVLKTVTPGIS